MTVIDEQIDRRKFFYLSFVEFLEFICRLSFHLFSPKYEQPYDFKSSDSIYVELENLLALLFKQIDANVIRNDEVPLESQYINLMSGGVYQDLTEESDD